MERNKKLAKEKQTNKNKNVEKSFEVTKFFPRNQRLFMIVFLYNKRKMKKKNFFD